MNAAGQYYVPSAHPYQHTLSDGVKVLEAQPGNYYAFGAHGPMVTQAAAGMGQDVEKPNTAVMVWSALSTASMAVSAYHGYKRNDSVGWALGWGLLGSLFPVITPAVALAQGFGKRKAGR